MASSENGAVALLAIAPEFADAIISGQKRVEFRRVGFARNVTTVVVYATSPRGRIVGYFDVEETVRRKPDTLWRRFGQVGCIDKARFRDYYAGCDRGTAILIGAVFRFVNAPQLSVLGEDSRAPQSYRYLSESQWKRLKRRATLMSAQN